MATLSPDYPARFFMEKNDRSNRERIRNQEDDPHEQGTRGDQDKMSERESQPHDTPSNVVRGEQAIGKQPHVRMEDDERKKSER